MATNQENARKDWDTIHIGRVETLVELDELGNKCHIWVGNSPSFSNVFQAFIHGDLLSEDHIA